MRQAFFYNHTDQWRYERITPQDLLSPLASPESVPKTMIDCNVMAERLGWLPSAPQLSANPLNVARSAKESGKDAAQYVRDELVSGRLKMANQRPDSPENWPRNLFVWRSNLLGSSGKGLEYFFQHLIGAGENHFNTESDQRPDFVEWAEKAPQGKLDLLVTLDFRMSTTALFSDIVLPAATWYEKTDLSTSDMHSFIHPFQPAIPPAWEAREDWTIFRGIAKKFQELAKGHLGEEADIVLSPLGKDTPAELSQPYGARDWLKEKDAPAIADKISDAAGVSAEVDAYEAQLGIFLDPHDPEVVQQARKDGMDENWIIAAQKSPVYQMVKEWRIAFPLHPEYRTLPMVWYVPPLSPITEAADSGFLETIDEVPDIKALRIPVRYLANLLTSGDETPIRKALETLLALRGYMRRLSIKGVKDQNILNTVGLTAEQMAQLYKLLAIANYEDRFVVPPAHKEENEEAYIEKGLAGFHFNQSAGDGLSRFRLWGGKSQETKPVIRRKRATERGQGR